MSCKEKWQEYNDQLQAATQLAPGSADAAPRCVKPECNRPLLKDGTCVMGHAQAAGTQPSPTPLRAALRCVFEDAVAAAGQHSTQWYYSYMQKALDSTRDLIDKIADDTADPAAIEELLEALIWLQDNEPYSTVYSNLYLDPRVQAAARLVSSQRLAVAAERAADPAQMLAALQGYHAAAQWSARWKLTADHDQAVLGMQQLLPSRNLDTTADLVVQQLNAIAGSPICRRTGGWSAQILQGTGIKIALLPTDQLDFYPDEARQLLRRELGSAVPPDLAAMPSDINVPTQALSQFLWRRLQELDAAVDELAALQDDLPALVGQMPPVELARKHALPLYREAMRMQGELQDGLRAMGAPGEAVLERIIQVKHQALQALQAVPVREWPQALADYHYAPRVLDLLKFRAVRAAVCDPRNGVDMLAHLPRLAPRAIAAIRGCELVESALARGLGADPHVSRRAGPQGDEAVVELVQAGDFLDRAEVKDLAAQAGDPENITPWQQAVGTLVDALSEHAPAGRTPRKYGEEGYEYGSRLQQARRAWNDSLGCGLNTDISATAVRKWAEAASMPLGRYADRSDIVRWLKQPAAERAETEQNVRLALRGKTSVTLRAVDRTGTDRLYKAKERVRLTLDGRELEGEVEECVFVDSDEADPAKVVPAPYVPAYARRYSDNPPAFLHPAVQVYFQDHARRIVPIAQVEVVKTKKK